MRQDTCFPAIALCFLSIVSLAFLVTGQEGQEVDPVAKLQRDFEEAMKADGEPLAEFETRYLGKLKALQQTFELQGNLDGALKVKTEIEGHSKNFERNYRDLPDLFRLRKIYDDNMKRLRAEAAARQITTGQKFVKAFED